MNVNVHCIHFGVDWSESPRKDDKDIDRPNEEVPDNNVRLRQKELSTYEKHFLVQFYVLLI